VRPSDLRTRNIRPRRVHHAVRCSAIDLTWLRPAEALGWQRDQDTIHRDSAAAERPRIDRYRARATGPLRPDEIPAKHDKANQCEPASSASPHGRAQPDGAVVAKPQGNRGPDDGPICSPRPTPTTTATTKTRMAPASIAAAPPLLTFTGRGGLCTSPDGRNRNEYRDRRRYSLVRSAPFPGRFRHRR